MTVQILVGDCRERMKEMQAGSVHCVVTSPPYWGLRDYGLPPSVWGGAEGCEHVWGDFTTPAEKRRKPSETVHQEGYKTAFRSARYVDHVADETQASGQFCHLCGAWSGCLGLEPTPDLFVAHMVEVMREVWRVLRDDGTCWLNLGSSYATNPGNGRGGETVDGGTPHRSGQDKTKTRFKPKDLIPIPWMVAMALQQDGWYLRSAIVWAKGLSFCPTYSGSVMPESVRDRPTSAYEMVFLLSKRKRYFYDSEAVREKWADSRNGNPGMAHTSITDELASGNRRYSHDTTPGVSGRNLRNVWTINPAGFPGAHFATFPRALVEPCIKAGTSERGVCPACGGPWERVVERNNPRLSDEYQAIDNTPKTQQGDGVRNDFGDKATGLAKPGWRKFPPEATNTLGWSPSCTCDAGEPVPATVLDFCGGSGTTALEARRLGRDCIIIDLSAEYCQMARRRLDGTEEIEATDHNGDTVTMEQATMFSGVVVG